MRPPLPDPFFAAPHALQIHDDAGEAGGATTPPIDLAQAEDRFGGPDRWARLLVIYLEDTGERIEKILAAIAARDLETIRKEAHSIKGASAQIHAEPMRDICTLTENAVRDSKFDDALEFAARIPATFESFRRHVSG